ncbi:Uncharacterised protein [Acinetobacter baumannii]|nr:Uncharacterised protein [Acinetobacter baumannii]
MGFRQGLQPCTCQKPKQQQLQKRVFRGMAGRCRSAGTLQVRPCKLGSRIHAADTPHSDTAPPSTGSGRYWWVPTVGRHICQMSNESSTHGVDLLVTAAIGMRGCW